MKVLLHNRSGKKGTSGTWSMEVKSDISLHDALVEVCGCVAQPAHGTLVSAGMMPIGGQGRHASHRAVCKFCLGKCRQDKR